MYESPADTLAETAASSAFPSKGKEATVLSSKQLLEFEELGFTALENITSTEDVARLRDVVISLFANKTGFQEGAQFNIVGTEEADEEKNILQIINPYLYESVLIETEFYANAFAIARQILGPKAYFSYSHVLLKPALDGPATPWHQDEASHDPRFEYRDVHIWMPFQPVDKVNGCMEFIPKSHRGEVLPHRSLHNNPRIHAIECYEGFDPADAVACPLPAGGCTIHSERTIHYTGPNRSAAPRYSYVLVFQIPHQPAAKPRDFPWLKEKKTARMKREREWNLRDGYVVFIARKIRNRLGRIWEKFLLRPLRNAGISVATKK